MRRLPDALFWPLALGLTAALACALAAPVHDVLATRGLLADDDRDFLRVLRRLLLVPMVVVFLWRVQPWRGGLFEPYGLRPPAAGVRTPLLAFGATILVLALVLLWQGSQGWLEFEDPPRYGELARRLALYSVGGLLIGLAEEWFFRGWLVARAAARFGARAAPWFVAIPFGFVHAFRPSTLAAPVTHDAAGAWQALGGWALHALHPLEFGPAAVGLACFSLLLSAAYARTGTLWTAIGIHAAAVLVLFSYGAITQRLDSPPWVGSRLLYDGPLLWALCLVATWLLGRPRNPAPQSG